MDMIVIMFLASAVVCAPFHRRFDSAAGLFDSVGLDGAIKTR